MENSMTVEIAEESAIDTAGESICDASESESLEEGGYIESKAPDFDDAPDSSFPDDGDRPVFSDRIMKYLDEITEKEEDTKKPAQPAVAQISAPKTAGEEEQAILASIPSERGRERVRAIIGAKNEAEVRYRENQGVLNRIRDFVEQSGVEPAELAQNFEYSRMIAQGDEESLRVALNMLEEQREMICKRLNVDRPGVDLLSDFPELKAAVERKEITPQHAARLARYERNEREAQRQQQEKEIYDRDNAGFLHDLERTKHAITSYFQTRSGEADHAFKVMRLYEHLRQPGVLDELARNTDSKRLFSQVRFMYDNIVVPPARSQPVMQPIRSRPTMQGPVSSRSDATLMQRMENIIESMGI